MATNPTSPSAQPSAPTWYDILGVPRDATPEQIKAAWRLATDKFEPGSGTAQFRLFNEAADVLLDPERRSAYDADLAATAPEVEAPEVEAPEVETPEVEPVETKTPEAGPVETPAPEVEPVETKAAEVEPVETPAPEVEPVETPAPEVEPVETKAAEVEPVETPDAAPGAGQGETHAPPAAGFLGRLAAVPVLVLAILGVLLVGSLVLAGVVGMKIHDRVEVADAGPDASAAAERALTAVLSYDYRHMEADRDRAARFLTPSYRKQYLKNFDDLLAKGPDGAPGPVEKTKAVVTADVLDTGVVDAERNRVRVVVFVNQSSVKGDEEPTLFQNRVVATLVRSGDNWLVDNIKSY